MKIPVLFLLLVASAVAGTIQAPKYSDYDFGIQFTPSASLLALAGTSTATSGNRNVTGFIPTAGATAADVTVIPSGIKNTNTADVVSISCVSASNSGVLVKVGTQFLTKKTFLTSALISGTLAMVPVGWLAGSLGRQMDDFIDGCIAASGTSGIAGKLSMFSSTSGTSTYVRNSGLWISGTGIDFSGISPWNNDGLVNASGPIQSKGGALVSPRHFICAYHYSFTAGSQIRFVSNSGTVATRTITGTVRIGSTDIMVCGLDSDVSAGICFYSVPPANLNNYASDYHLWPVPILTTDQLKRVYVSEVSSVYSGGISIRPPTSAGRAPFTHLAITGDSGSPCFFVINGRLVLAGCYLFPDFIPNISQNISAINAAMTSLGGGYQLTIADLSAFTSY